MSQEPTYPTDAVPGRVVPPAAPAAPAKDLNAPPAPTPDDSARSRWQTAGVALGIGSAAIAAALLYANRGKKP